MHILVLVYVPWSKVAILGMVIPLLIGILIMGININPYYWVDDHPRLYGNNGSLDPGTYLKWCSLMPQQRPGSRSHSSRSSSQLYVLYGTMSLSLFGSSNVSGFYVK